MEKTLFTVLLSVGLCVTTASISWSELVYVGKLESVHGSADILREGGKDLLPAKDGDSLFKGDRINTGPGSKATIVLRDKSTILMGGNSGMSVDEFVLDEQKEKRSALVNAFVGKFRVAVRSIGKVVATGKERMWRDLSFNIKTPTAVCGIKGTVVDVTTDGTTSEFGMVQGTAEIRAIDPKSGKPTGRAKRISAGKKAKVALGMPIEVSIYPKEQQDDMTNELPPEPTAEAPPTAVSPATIDSPSLAPPATTLTTGGGGGTATASPY